jgi:large subunit ribosomal protein L24
MLKHKKLHIKVGDKVFVSTGASKGKKAEVISINRKTSRVTIRGIEGDTLKPIKKHVKPNSDKEFPEGGIIEKDPTIHISNLMLLDPKTGEPTRIGRKRVEIELKGKKKTTSVRYSKKTQEEII